MKSIKQILIERDEMTEQEADDLILQAKQDLYEKFENGEYDFDICEFWFGLEPDYLMELI